MSKAGASDISHRERVMYDDVRFCSGSTTSLNTQKQIIITYYETGNKEEDSNGGVGVGMGL